MNNKNLTAEDYNFMIP